MAKDEDKILEKFATSMRLRRCELRISQMHLAELVDCHLNAIGRIERMDAIPSLVTAYRISKALKMTLDEMISEK